MRNEPLGRTRDQIGLRLRWLRLTLSEADNQAAWCREYGFTPQAWKNYEAGFRRPDLDAMIHLHDQTRCTLDFIYLGDKGGLPQDLFQRLQASFQKIDAGFVNN